VSPQAKQEHTAQQQAEATTEAKATEEELSPFEQAVAQDRERNKELLALSGSEREEKRAEFAAEDAEAGVTLSPEEQRIKDDEETAAPLGHIPTG